MSTFADAAAPFAPVPVAATAVDGALSTLARTITATDVTASASTNGTNIDHATRLPVTLALSAPRAGNITDTPHAMSMLRMRPMGSGGTTVAPERIRNPQTRERVQPDRPWL